MKYWLAIAGLLCAVNAQAGIYKWVDEKGNVHFGDRPSNGGEEVKLQQLNTMDSGAGSVDSEMSREERRQRISDALEEDRLAKKEEQEKKKQERARRQKECNYLRDKQRSFAQASGIYRLDKDGNRVFMPDNQRKSTEESLKKRIKDVCR